MPRAALVVSLLALSGCGSDPQDALASITDAPERCDPASTDPLPMRFERSPGGVPEVDAAWLEANHCRVRVVDVRHAEEVAVRRLDLAEHVPLDRVAEEAVAWDPSQPVVFVCRSGRRSARATRTLEDMGFTRAASMTGGLLVWETSGRALRRGPAPEITRAPSRTEASEGPLTLREIEVHVGEASSVRWVKVASLLMQGTQSCVDGRDERPVVGTPGGDAGELLLALAALEETRGERLSAPELSRLLDAHLEAFGRFYMHTDEHALGGLVEDARFETDIRAQGLERFLRHPPAELEPALREALTSPAHVGCGHLRLMLEHPIEYEVRPELTRALIGAVLTRLWQGEAIELVVLAGEHHEGAVINVHVADPIHAFTRIPTFSPRIGERELFVNHPEVSAWLREQSATFFFEVDPWLRDHPERRPEFLETLERMAASQLHATLTHLARSLPVISVDVGHEMIVVSEAPR